MCHLMNWAQTFQHLQQKWWHYIFFYSWLWRSSETFCWFQWSLTKNMEWIHKNEQWQINCWAASALALYCRMLLPCQLPCFIASIVHSWLLKVRNHLLLVGWLRSLHKFVLHFLKDNPFLNSFLKSNYVVCCPKVEASPDPERPDCYVNSRNFALISFEEPMSRFWSLWNFDQRRGDLGIC